MSIHETLPLNCRSDLPLLSRRRFQNQEFCLYKETPLTYTMQLFPKAYRLTWFEKAHEEANTILQLGESNLVQWRTQGRLLAIGERGTKSLMPCVWGFTAHAIPSSAVPQHSVGVLHTRGLCHPQLQPCPPSPPHSSSLQPSVSPTEGALLWYYELHLGIREIFATSDKEKYSFYTSYYFFLFINKLYSAKPFKVPHLTYRLFHV